jgi:hypothetical protein
MVGFLFLSLSLSLTLSLSLSLMTVDKVRTFAIPHISHYDVLTDHKPNATGPTNSGLKTSKLGQRLGV